MQRIHIFLKIIVFAKQKLLRFTDPNLISSYTFRSNRTETRQRFLFNVFFNEEPNRYHFCILFLGREITNRQKENHTICTQTGEPYLII